MRSLAAAVILHALAGVPAAAAPVLRSAEVTVAMTSISSCDVTMRLSVAGLGEDGIDHRIDSHALQLIDVTGAQRTGEVRAIGRTQSLVLRPLDRFYQLHYTAVLPKGREYRCPLWLPTIPTDGQSRTVLIRVEIPKGAIAASDSMPSLTWNEGRGETALAHLPVMVHVPFTADGASPPWSVSRTVDTFTIAIIAVASAIWVWWRKR